MTGNRKIERAALTRLADTLVDDILNAPDEEILNDFREVYGDPDRFAGEMKQAFEKSVIRANKNRLAAAKAGVRASRPAVNLSSAPVDIASARARLRAVMNMPNVTLAARKESELSDADVLGMLDDLRELGVLPPDDGRGGKS